MPKHKFPIPINLLLLTISPKTSLMVHLSQSRRGWERHNEGLMRFDCLFDIVHCLHFIAEKCNMPWPKNALDSITKADGTSFLWKLTLNGTSTKTRGVSCHTVALPFYIKKYLKAKEEFWKLKYFTMQKYNLQKNPLKENQNPSRYITTL